MNVIIHSIGQISFVVMIWNILTTLYFHLIDIVGIFELEDSNH